MAPARKLHVPALAEAERLFVSLTGGDSRAPADDAEHRLPHNLAQVAARDGDEPECRRWPVLAFDRLADAALQPATPLELRIVCIQHLKYTITELAEPWHARSTRSRPSPTITGGNAKPLPSSTTPPPICSAPGLFGVATLAAFTTDPAPPPGASPSSTSCDREVPAFHAILRCHRHGRRPRPGAQAAPDGSSRSRWMLS